MPSGGGDGGGVLALITLIVFIVALRRPALAEGICYYTAFEAAFLLASVVATEIDLRRNFDERGQRRDD